MKTKLIATTLLSLAALATLPAAAQSVKPGLWEVKSTGPQTGAGNSRLMAEQMARAQEYIAAMPAAQRKQVEAAMAQAGASDVRFSGDGMSLKHCVSKEQAADYSSLITREGNCTVKRSAVNAGTATFDMSCTTPPATGSGTIRFQGDTAYTLDMTMTTAVNGQDHTAKVNSSGKWLGADCGAVKPAARGR